MIFHDLIAGTAMTEQVPLSSDASALQPALDAARDDKTHELLPDLAYRRLGIVNVVFVGSSKAGNRSWVLIDAGLLGTKGLIKSAAAERFGSDARPAAIIMTHAHFDHVGGAGGFGGRVGCPRVRPPARAPLPERAGILSAR
jgi:glyoxylase-like metal-dependent hydrolase (beta-lactamase superfamily II)